MGGHGRNSLSLGTVADRLPYRELTAVYSTVQGTYVYCTASVQPRVPTNEIVSQTHSSHIDAVQPWWLQVTKRLEQVVILRTNRPGGVDTPTSE